MRPFLLLNPGSEGEQRLDLKMGTTSIGRNIDNDIVIAHPTLSRKHAVIEMGIAGVTIVDLNSRNGTSVNAERVERRDLKDGDMIRCGDAEMRFVATLDVIARASSDAFASSMKELLAEEGGTVLGSALRLKPADQATRSADQLRVLLKVSELLSSPQQIDSVLDSTLKLLFDVMDVDRGVIFLVDESNGELATAAVRLAPGLSSSQPLASQHILKLVLSTETGVVSSDAVADPRFAGAASVAEQSIRASMCVPLKARDTVLGVLYVDNLVRAGVFGQADLDFLMGFANQAAVAIENMRLYRKIEEESIARNKLIRFFPRSVVTRLMQSKNLTFTPVEADVTILFADICDFTQMSATLAPRQIVALLNEYFPVMADVVFRHGGTLEKYIGDALMAIWGAPLPVADGADLALRAAVEMQQRLRQLNDKWRSSGGHHIEIHIGLNSGHVAAGNIGSSDYIQYAAIGDSTNVASRICSVAQRGEILLSEATWGRVVDKSTPVVPYGPVQVKGIAAPLNLYYLKWDSPPAGSALGADSSSETAPRPRYTGDSPRS